MKINATTDQDLMARLVQAEEILEAIRNLQVDAIINSVSMESSK